MKIPHEGWAIAMTKPMAEFVAQDALRRRGRRVCLPVYRKVLVGKRRSRGELVIKPLFQSYLFVEMHPGQEWINILYTPGVNNLVRCTGDRDLPALLEPELVAEIYAKSEAGDFDDRRLTDKIKVRRGEKMRIADGPFASFIAKLQEVDDRGRAQTLLALFNREVPAEFNYRDLERVSA